MYESPIDIIYSEMQTKLEGEVFKAVQNVGINVNKDELIKALSYDRQQYEKGYADAKAEQQWIPVSSGKLPENSITLVLVQIGEKCPDVELAFYDYNRECWENARHYQKIPDVIAWMPLPEPYREGGAEECH